MRPPFFLHAILSTFLLLPGASLASTPPILASLGDAYVSQGADGARSWSIGTSRIQVGIVVDPSAGLQVQSIQNPVTGTDWILPPGGSTTITVAGAASVPGAKGSPFAFVSAATAATGTGVSLDLTFVSASLGLRAVRHYASYRTAPVVETWTTIELTSARFRSIENLNSWQLPLAGNRVQWVAGLHPDWAGLAVDAFTAQQHDVAVGETFTIGAQGRSSESAVPFFLLQRGGEQAFGGMEWSGAWSAVMTGVEGGVKVALGLPPMSTTIRAGETLQMPRAFFGVAAGGPAQATLAVRAFIAEGLRPDRPFRPLVTSNTWFAHGVAIDEESMTGEMDAAADLGAELFVLDAGYYPGAGANDSSDFTSGLGTWTWDTTRFPSGLPALAQAAHDRGLKFGLWVEPERVALSTVGQAGLAQSSFLAMHDDRYDPAVPAAQSRAAQICLASSAARAWVLDRLTRLIDAVHPDYLKWDNNFWVNCNRAGHGHGDTDGNFLHVQGLYAILSALRDRYPDLVIENCSGGGHRLDFGILRYTDVGWMDDRTSPATVVRHNFEGLLTVLPPSYLFSFVLDTDANPQDGRLDLDLTFRSRMPGVFGLGFSAAAASDAVKAAARREVATYKSIRDIQDGGSGALLSAQVDGHGAPAWDAIQLVEPDTGNAVVFAFQVDGGARRTTVQPVALVPGATYQVVSADAGVLATASGADLMNEGIEIDASPATAAHVLTLRVVQAPGS